MLELFSNADITNDTYRLYQTSAQGSGDFTNLNWTVTPSTTYKIKLTSVTSGRNLSVPITSPCSSCTYHIQWGDNVETRTPDGKTPHSQTDAYPNGGAQSESSYFSDISGGGKADIARLAVWGETIPIPSAPTNLTSSCPLPGTQATLSWSLTANATYYALRVDNTVDPWDRTCTSPGGDFCSNETSTSKTFTSTPGSTYSWWIHACNSSGCSQPASGGNFTCTAAPAASAPSITSLKLNNFSPNQTSTSGIYGTNPVIGRQATQQGAGWLNPMRITLNVNAGDGISQRYYVSFYDQKKGGVNVQSAFGTTSTSTASTFLSDIQNMLYDHPDAGWLLRYDPASPAQYYVWDHKATSGTDCLNVYGTVKGCFVNITGLETSGKLINNNAYTPLLLYTVFPISDSPSWEVLVDANMGSKRLYTAGYAISTVGSDLKPDMTPSQ